MPKITKKIEKLARELSQLIREEVKKGLAAPGPDGGINPQTDAGQWVSAFVDARWFADAESWKSKLRIVLPNGTLQGLHTTRDMKNLLREIWKLRNEGASAKWYGLKVSVTYEGVVSTDFDNDPNCVVDPMWYQS